MSGHRFGGRQQGVLDEWSDERGFGFISPPDGAGRVFVHISAFPPSRRPTVGSQVTFEEVVDSRARPRASAVRYVGSDRAATTRRASTPRRRSVRPQFAVALAFMACVLVLAFLGEVPAWTVGGYAALSGVAFLTYRADKAAARQGARRTPESTLHGIDLLGGWPGGLVARHVLRHKTTKQPFRTVFWVTVLANCAALAAFVVVR